MNSVGKSSAKYDQDKLRWDLIPLEAVEECVKILTFGAQKYGENRSTRVEAFFKFTLPSYCPSRHKNTFFRITRQIL